jgi:hypothetical protein
MFVFLSKWKCASESVRDALAPYTDIFSSQRYPYYHHTPAVSLKKHFEKQGWNWDDYYSFIVIRNPWDMLVSFYYYVLPDKEGKYHWDRNWDDIVNDRYLPEHRMIPGDVVGFDEWITTFDLTWLTLDRFINDDDGTRLVNDIYKVETLDQSLEKIARVLKLPAPLPAIHRNASKHPPASFCFTEQTTEIVKKVFALDIEVGGYAPPKLEASPKIHFFPALEREQLELLITVERDFLLKSTHDYLEKLDKERQKEAAHKQSKEQQTRLQQELQGLKKELASVIQHRNELHQQLKQILEQYAELHNRMEQLKTKHNLVMHSLEELRFLRHRHLRERLERVLPFSLGKVRHLDVETVATFVPETSEHPENETGKEILPIGYSLAEEPHDLRAGVWLPFFDTLRQHQSKTPAVYLVPCLERFGDSNQRTAITTDWIGMLHMPKQAVHFMQQVKQFSELYNPMRFSGAMWEKSAPFCRGLLVFSEYHADQVRQACDVPVHLITPPVATDLETWDKNAYSRAPKPMIVQPDDLPARYHGLHLLDLPDFDKVLWTRADIHPLECIEHEEKYLSTRGLFPYMRESVSVAEAPEREKRKATLASCIVFTHLYAPVVPASLLDCMGSATPILVNPQPPVAELLGADYPLYYCDYEEAAEKARDLALLVQAHEHLLNLAQGVAQGTEGLLNEIEYIINELP